MPTVTDLGKAFKLSHQGAYDDLADDQVGQAVKAKYPGAYDDFEDTPSPSRSGSGPGRGGNAASNNPPTPPAASQRFLGGLYDSTIGPIKHIFDVGGPKALEEMGTAARDNIQNYIANPTFKNSVKSIPLIGPPLVAPYEQAQSGDVAGAMGTGLGTAASVLAPEAIARTAPARLAAPPLLRNVNNPVEQSALNYAASRDIPMTAGQRTGQQGVQRAEQSLENFPGSSTRTGDFYRQQREALSTEAQTLAQRASPVSTNPYETGLALQQKLKQNINGLKSQADRTYGDVRTDAAAQQQTIQVGNKPVVSTASGKPVIMYGSNGQPLTVPVTQTYNSPVDLEPIVTALQPVFDDFKRSLPVARQQASPAFAALSDLMNRRMNVGAAGEAPSQRYMDVLDFDKALGAIKSLSRDGNSPNLSTQSQGVAKQIIKFGEDQVKQSLPPQTYAKLQSARDLVRRYHDIDELLQDQQSEPAALYNNLVTGGDRTLDTLKALQQQAPQQVQTVGRTFLTGLVDKATREGGWGRADGVAADWNRLGPETKKVLFGPQLTSDMNNFVLAAKRLTNNKNPSGTASTMAALYGYGSVGASIWALLQGHPGEAASTVGAAYALPNTAARMLFTPGGARLLTEAISVPVNTPAFRQTMRRLTTIFGGAQALPKPPSTDQQ